MSRPPHPPQPAPSGSPGRTRSAKLSLALLLCGLLLASLAAPPIAAAATAPDPLGSGLTTLTLARPFKRLLAAHGVSFPATAPPRHLLGPSYPLPRASGEVNPIDSRLALEEQGTLVFSRGHRKVIVRHLSLKTTQTPLLAKVGGGQLKIASATSRHFTRQGFGAGFKADGLRLTAKFATRLSKKLALHEVFKQGQPLGSLRARVQPATVAILPQGRFSLTPDPAFLAKLDGLFVSLNPIAPAERQPGPLFSVPFIPAGTIAPDASSGIPRSGGSLEFLQLAAGQLFWHELWFDLGVHQVLAEVDIEPTPTFPGKLGQLPILDLDTSAATLSSDPRSRTVALAGAHLALNATSAAQFNQAFAAGKPSFQPGESLGTISFTAQGH
jgi:hypothetical protein